MSELALTLMRWGFLLLLWFAVFAALAVLRKDLMAPREARAVNVQPSTPVVPGTSSKGRGRRASGRKLLVVEGELKGTAVPLGTGVITVGRAPDSTIVLQDDYVSTRHARLYPSGSDWVVEDLGSTNGTWINKTRVTTPTILPVGADLRIGQTHMRIGK
jgi:pSer/pThr/pTyr-binding forkhead associated (FHA) protein